MPNLRFFYDDSEIYESDDPVFYPDPERFPEVGYVLDNYATIRREATDYLSGTIDIPYFNPSPPKMNGPQIWRNFYFKNYSLPYRLGRRYFPETFRIFAERPEFTLAGITTLEPGGRLMSHCGETNAVIRCHVGLKVPGTLPDLGLKVNGESVCWQEGKVLAFTDAYQHEVWNDTAESRYVLAFDIVRPEFRRYRAWICAHCLALQIVRFGLERLRMYDQTPGWLRSLLTKPFAVPLWCYLVLASIMRIAKRRASLWLARWRPRRIREERAATFRASRAEAAGRRSRSSTGVSEPLR